MAKKEERIWIEYEIPKPPKAIEATRCTTMTRQEAIERMAKVIRKKLFKNEGPTQKIKEEGLEQEYNRYVDFMCEHIAEAALNAIAPMIPLIPQEQ